MKGKYGLKAALFMCGREPGSLTQSAEIAEAHGISKKFLDAILAELRVAGLVVTRKGRNGGYQLSRRPEAITVGEVLRALDGPLAPIACASRQHPYPCSDCPDPSACAVRSIMLEVRDAISGVLDERSLAALAQDFRSPEIRAVVD